MDDACMEKLCKMKKALVDYTVDATDGDLAKISTHELGEVVDIIKDLYQAEKYVYEACYYKDLVVNGMRSNESPYTWDFVHDKMQDNDPQETMSTLKRIWDSSTSESKIKMRTALTKLLEEMVI